MKNNVSHLLLQYEVYYRDDTPAGEIPFTKFMLCVASEHVANAFFGRMLTDAEIRNTIQELRKMFCGQQPLNRSFFGY